MDAVENQIQNIKKLWDFNWGAMDVLIGGRSSIDLDKLRFKNWQDATEFIKYYGFDPESAVDSRKIHAVIVESWNFIERYLIPKEWEKGLKPPEDLLRYQDVRDIILSASDVRPEKAIKQAWACSVLRVMHTIAHIDGVQRYADFPIARDQIMQRFQKFIFRDEVGQLRFGKNNLSIGLSRIEWKYQKPRESIILKLLHKKANVTETIYDLIGMRIVTRNLCDVLVVVKFLRDFHMVTFANCNPSRARNSLMDVESFRHNVETLKVMLDNQKISPSEFSSLLQSVTRHLEKNTARINPHSGHNYRSIQLTCRQLIRMPSRSSIWQKKLVDFIEKHEIKGDHISILQDIARLLKLDNEKSRRHLGFFPFEIQVMDEETFQKNMLGDANHGRYKQSQIKSARRRVLAKVLTNKFY